MSETNDFNALRISLASPEQIRNWSYGEVTKPETINYRTLKPEKDGLFCERIFGPTKDFECYCGKYKRLRYKGIICDRCGVEVARSKVRRERMGHIELAAPVSHLWFAKGTPSRMGLLLDLSPRSLERVLYFSQYLITSVDETERARLLEDLRGQFSSRSGEVQQALDAQSNEVRQRRDDEMAELHKRRQAAEQAVEAELNAAVNETASEARLATEAVATQAGKVATEDIMLFEELLIARDTRIETAQAAEIESRHKARIADIVGRFGDIKMERTELIDAEIDMRRDEAIKEINQVERQREIALKEIEEQSQADMGEMEDIGPRKLLTENEYRDLRERFPSLFKAGMGAEAVLECLQQVDMEALRSQMVEEIHSTSGQRRKKATKTLRVVEAFRKSGNNPTWMILKVLPVLPPDLRPMVQLDGGRFATSDLNDLYRRVINRNNRLRRLLELGAPEIIIRNEKRMLQEAVDALIDNGRRGRAIAGSHNHKLKSLSDMLRGKQGRFRQNLLGKRVDYSGRSVIVVGPELRLDQCGLPKRMALELFKPFVMHELVGRGLAHNIKSAKRMVERVRPEVWDVLEEVIQKRPVFLNRAPTLHRLGIQAFHPILIEGSAIQIHPLVCAAFNADFDGDQMAVHVPLSEAAVLESNRLMLSTYNMLSPSSGEPVVAPTLDMVMGCFYLTQIRLSGKGAGKRFASPQQVRLALDLEEIELQAEVMVRGLTFKTITEDGKTRELTPQDYIQTTVGRIIFNDVVPKETNISFKNYVVDKSKLKDLVAECYHLFLEEDRQHGNEKTATVLDAIKRLGFHYATQSGATIAITDVRVPETKAAVIADAEGKVTNLQRQFQRGLITEDERYRQTVDIWTKASEEMENTIKDRMAREGISTYGSISLMATSGAKGNIAQIKQMAGMRGLMTDPRGRIIELPIKSSFREGLSVLEYFISTHGARKGLADTALRTADSGYLTRRLIDVCQDVIVMDMSIWGGISPEDCGATTGVWLHETPDKPLMGKFEERLVGRLASTPWVNPITDDMVVDANQEIDEIKAKQITSALVAFRIKKLTGAGVPADDVTKASATWLSAKRYLTENKKLSEEQALDVIDMATHSVNVRSPLTCRARRGVCQRCYGRSLARGRLSEFGEAVGIIAAQSIGEPGTQLTMRTFHTGGVAGLDITSGLPRVEELFEARSPKGMSVISEIDGTIAVREADDGRWITVTSEDTYTDEYAIAKGYRALVEDGSEVEVGMVLAQPVEEKEGVTDITARISGRVTLEGGRLQISYAEKDERQYLVPPAARLAVAQGQRIKAGDRLTEGPINPQDILRIQGREGVESYMVEEVQKVYRAQGVAIHDKHIELVVRQMLRKVRIDAPGDTELLPGHLLDRFTFGEVNARIVAEGGEPATAQPVLLGVTKASLNTESFLAAASFQETTRVLTEAAVNGQVDRLSGPKENVIIGRLIPARSPEITAELAKPKPMPMLQPLPGEEDKSDGPTEEQQLLELLDMGSRPAIQAAADLGLSEVTDDEDEPTEDDLGALARGEDEDEEGKGPRLFEP